ncbi:hypothetical protein LC653_27670 [Nostoc sp. CHAB 5784]|uniref:hypothetical protein n=1 Tax=Nostoc mirabile TaxID=2907820 RepID=UPI001E47512E|nr:hypothetical protein [Nostoc mirabile]MCC5667558.1 hypothetical protein [Nostoc mirabile CHAB5784]
MSLKQFLVTLALIIGSFPLVIEQADAQTKPPNSEVVPQELVQRLLNAYTGKQLQLLVGQLPKELPTNLPLPNGAKVAASIIYNNADKQESFEIFLDASQSPEQVQAFYREQLLSAGWQSLDAFSRTANRGFVSTDSTLPERSTFCKTSIGPFLSIITRRWSNTFTDVSLLLNSGFLILSAGHSYNNANNPCSDKFRQRYLNAAERFDIAPMPLLSAPPKTSISVSPYGSGVGNDSLISKATLKTELDSQALASHYEAQFKQAGWTRIDAKSGKSLILSVWMLKDKKGKSWQAILTLTKNDSQPSQYSASAIVSQL